MLSPMRLKNEYVLSLATRGHPVQMGICSTCRTYSPCEGLALALMDQRIEGVQFWMSHERIWTVYLASEGEVIVCDSQWHDGTERLRIVFPRDEVATRAVSIPPHMPKPRITRSALDAAYGFAESQVF